MKNIIKTINIKLLLCLNMLKNYEYRVILALMMVFIIYDNKGVFAQESTEIADQQLSVLIQANPDLPNQDHLDTIMDTTKLKTPVNIISKRLKQRENIDVIPKFSFVKDKNSNVKYMPPPLKETPEEAIDVVNVNPNKPMELNQTGAQGIEDHEIKAANVKNTNFEYNYKNLEISVVSLRINDKLSYDFEIIVWPNGAISIPIKALTELLDIPIVVNHVDNNISFQHPSSQEQITIDYKNNRILAGSTLIDVKSPKMVYVKEGFLVNDDIFIPEQIAQYLLDIKTNFTKERYTLGLDTKRTLKAIIQLEEQEKGISCLVYEEPTTAITTSEKTNKMFKIKQLNYSIGSTMNQTQNASGSSGYQSTRMSITSKGSLLGGKYNVGTNTFYNKYGLEVSGYNASLDYIGSKGELSLGNIYTRLSDIAVPGANIIGLKYGTLGAANSTIAIPRLITGKADENTQVELFINDIYTDRQIVQNGRFEFESVNYPKSSFVKVRVEQVNPDNTRKIVYDREFSQDKDILAPGQKEFLSFSGIDSSIMNSTFNLFGNGISARNKNPIKLSSGVKYRMGITRKLALGTNFAKTFMLRRPDNTLYSYSSSPKVLRQAKTTSGYVANLDLNYLPISNLRVSSEAGLSSASSTSVFEPDKTDIGGFVSLDYSKDTYRFLTKAFSYGPDFYSASYSDTIDKRGFEISGDCQVGSATLAASITKYNSNLDKAFTGGISDITNYYLVASGPINENASIRTGIRSSIAENHLLSDSQTDFSTAINSKLYDKANLTLEFIKNLNKDKDYQIGGRNITLNDRFNAWLDIDANKLGIIRLSHEVLMFTPEERLLAEITDTSVSKNIYLKFDRTNKPLKRFTISPNIGYRYSGEDKGILFGTDLGYILSNGKQIMLTYSYNSTFARYGAGGLNIGGNHAHTLSFNFVDSLNIGMTGAANQNIGNQAAFNPENSIIKGCVFLDLNQNSIKDPEEEGISDIDVTIKDMYTITTDKNGNYIAPNLGERTYIISINKEILPVIYTPTSNDLAVNVKREKVYVANLGLIVTPGSISGKVELGDNSISKSDIVILLFDINGKEVKYTTTDSEGSYYIGSISPGEYNIVVDKNYLDYNGLQVAGREIQKVNIPPVVDDFVDINDINFKLIEKDSQVKEFK